MCTVVVLRRPGNAWPLILAANRDEMAGRPWLPPGRHWPERANVVGGLDRLAGGSWLGLNDEGVVAAVSNRAGSLGPQEGKRSRRELVLEALDHPDAAAAAEALAYLDPSSYRSFNLVVADNRDAFWLRGLGAEGPTGVLAEPIPPGVSMITALDRSDLASARIRTHLPLFEAAPPPEPDRGDFAAWEKLLGARTGPQAGGGENAEAGALAGMTVATGRGFATVSSAILALPAPAIRPRKPVWRFAAGPPDRVPFGTVVLVG